MASWRLRIDLIISFLLITSHLSWPEARQQFPSVVIALFNAVQRHSHLQTASNECLIMTNVVEAHSQTSQPYTVRKINGNARDPAVENFPIWSLVYRNQKTNRGAYRMADATD